MPRLRQFRLAVTCIGCVVGLFTIPLPGQTSERTPDAPITGPCRIAGVAVDAKTSSPLSRARITIIDARNFRKTQSVVTGDDGRFEFRAPAGKFGLQGAKRGYLDTAYEQHQQFSTAIVTGAGLNTENLVLRVVPSAILAGKVLDENGEPVRDANVMVYREDRSSGVSRIRRFRGGQTNDQGEYEVPQLDAGTYFVSVQAQPWYAVNFAARSLTDGGPGPQVDNSLDVAYPITYYGDVSEADQAVPIPVRGGDRLQADIHLTPVPALHLLFRVSEDAQHGLVFPQLEGTAFDEIEPISARGVQEVTPGVYEITGVPAGRYLVRMPDSEGQLQAPMAVDLASSQELTAPSGSSTSKVTFTVQVPGEEKLPAQIQIGLRNSKGRVVASRVTEKSEAEFSDLLPGKYDIVAGSPSGPYSVAAMTTADSQTSQRSLDVPPAASLTVSITLVGGSVRVEGFAKRAGKPAPGAMIVLVPKDPEANGDRFRRDQSDLDGSFALQNVVPGQYSVIAIEDGWDLDWAKPAVLERYREHAQPLTVSARATGTQRVPKPVEVQPH